MKNRLNYIALVLCLIIVPILLISCSNSNCSIAEKVTLANTNLGEIEFENSDEINLKQNCNEIVISGKIDAMSPAQANAFGDDNSTHVVVLKFEFDKEKTISSFSIKGNKTKVFSTNEQDENYAGSLTDLLDNEPSEDASCYLILSANTNSYVLTANYTDSTSVAVNVSITATLVSSNPE